MPTGRLFNQDAAMSSGSIVDRRAAALREAELQEAERLERLSALTLPGSGPQERIRAWERVHALALPDEPTHSLVRVIARRTQLTVAQVIEEQARRRAPAAVSAQ